MIRISALDLLTLIQDDYKTIKKEGEFIDI
jgi:hypothetical protein